jgi:Response regulators consisting of a CheY-like receiver domain and a winged-helix DNA-binding domain
MKVMIVESEPDLATLWRRHLERQGAVVRCVRTGQAAMDMLEHDRFDVIVLDLFIDDASALSVADVASFRHPETRVIFVTNSRFFSDGSIFQHSANVCAFVQSATPPEDLTAMVEHYATRA